MRALEFERPMVRATNTGATAIIDPGAWSRTSWHATSAGVLVGQVGAMVRPHPMPTGPGAGAWPLWALGGLVLMMAALRKRVPKGPRHTG
jgi:apolipoprotein N-acyltransferase